MNKCRKCGKTLPEDSKGKLCEYCLNKRNQAIRKYGGIALTALSAVPIVLGKIKRR